MADGGLTTAMVIASAASTAVSAVGMVAEQEAISKQQEIDTATINLNREQSKLQAAEKARVEATNFRRALSQQVALAQHRGGSGSVVRQFSSESFSNFLQDQAAIERGSRFVDTKANLQQSERSVERNMQRMQSFTRFGQTLVSNFGSAARGMGGGG